MSETIDAVVVSDIRHATGVAEDGTVMHILRFVDEHGNTTDFAVRADLYDRMVGAKTEIRADDRPAVAAWSEAMRRRPTIDMRRPA